MRAIVVDTVDGRPSCVWSDGAPEPECGPHEVKIRVRACGVNRADLMQARGLYPPPPGASQILGLEAAGQVVAAGPGVKSIAAGERVFVLLSGGGYAEYVCAHEDMVLKTPEHWADADAAAVPEAWYTAFLNLFLEGKLRAGERVLIHAGASGVGTAAIQLARESGAEVHVTAGSKEKCDLCSSLGSASSVCYKESDFEKEIERATGGKGVDLVLDCVGGDFFPKNLRLLAPGGRLVLIGLMGGKSVQVDLAEVLGKRLNVIGSKLRTRPLGEKIALTAEFKKRCLPGLESGKMRPVVDTQFPIEACDEAHEYMRTNRNLGKIVLTVPA